MPDREKGRQIVDNLLGYFGVSIEDVKSKLDTKELRDIRQILFFTLYHEANYTHTASAGLLKRSVFKASFHTRSMQKHMEDSTSERRDIAIDFFMKYGYCKSLWGGKEESEAA